MLKHGLLLATLGAMALIAPLAQAMDCLMHAAPAAAHEHTTAADDGAAPPSPHHGMAVAECFDLPALVATIGTAHSGTPLHAAPATPEPVWGQPLSPALLTARGGYDPPPDRHLAALQPDLIVTTARRRV